MLSVSRDENWCLWWCVSRVVEPVYGFCLWSIYFVWISPCPLLQSQRTVAPVHCLSNTPLLSISLHAAPPTGSPYSLSHSLARGRTYKTPHSTGQ